MDYNRSEHQSEQINELVAAIVKAQLAMEPAKKEVTNPFFHKKYADLPTCWQAVESFRKEGIAIVQSPAEGPDGFVLLDTQLSHTSGQWMRSRLKIRIAKDDPQGYGSAITYARRYALGCMTGLVTEEDDDGNAASHPAPQAQRVMQHKQTAQAKINELRSEGVASGSSRPDPATPAEQAGTLTPVQDLTISGWGSLLGAMENDPDLADLLLMVKEQCGLKSLAYPKVSPKDRVEFLTALQKAAVDNGLAARMKALGL